MAQLYLYKMTHDTEFAPNPHKGVLTLATCKPTIRRCAHVDDWVSGWTAKQVYDKDGRPVSFPVQRLLYLARITKKITIAEYWNLYPQKRPQAIIAEGNTSGCGKSKKNDNCSLDFGDNIYEPEDKGTHGFKQHVNAGGHGENDIKHDLSGKYVLICEEYYYMGVHHSLEVPQEIVPYNIPRCKKVVAEDSKLIGYVKSQYNPGINKRI